MFTLLPRVRRRIELNCARLGVSYPWWIPAYSTAGLLVLAAIAYGQRGALAAPWPVSLGAVLVVLPVVGYVRGWLVAPWMNAVLVMSAAALFLTDPQPVDFAPLLLMILAGELGATTAFRWALLFAGAEIGLLVGMSALVAIDAAPLYVFGVLVGVDVGVVLRWQMRALAAERANGSIRLEQATLAERQRIAREIHDVVGHTLSINLLHVTAARHALQQHRDVDDAIESLVAAEQVGRAAMTDLRRTVSLLNAGPSETQALPTAADVPDLVERSRAAGLAVDYECAGSLSDVDAAAGLGVYRIVQESLANIAKHAPGSTARVCIGARPEVVTVSVRNTLAPDAPANAGGGTGLPGMAARAEQIGAALQTGRIGDEWVVEFALPLLGSEPVSALVDPS